MKRLIPILITLLAIFPALLHPMKRKYVGNTRQIKTHVKWNQKSKQQHLKEKAFVAKNRRKGKEEDELYHKTIANQPIVKSPGFISGWGHRKKKDKLHTQIKTITIKFKRTMTSTNFNKFFTFMNNILHKYDRRITLAAIKGTNWTSLTYWIENYITIERFQLFIDRTNRQYLT